MLISCQVLVEFDAYITYNDTKESVWFEELTRKWGVKNHWLNCYLKYIVKYILKYIFSIICSFDSSFTNVQK